jgi:tetratricopeptide (TPR) repeat protein
MLAALSVSVCGCRHADPPGRFAPPPPAEPGRVTFTDVTENAGISFTHTNGARGRFLFPEAEPPGCVFFDYDNDGAPDIFIANGMEWPGASRGHPRSTPVLYHNRGDGTFVDVTRQAGLDVEMYAMGAVAGDYDNDGREDLYVTCVNGQSRLFHNEGGRFQDVTARAGVDNGGRWATAALWIDVDNDGRLDLFVGNYCRWSLATDRPCTPFGTRSYCTPAEYEGEKCRLYHNRGDGTFQDVTPAAGLSDLPGKTLGAAMLDYDGDGRPDILLANDLEPTVLLHNNGNGTFTDTALESGIALAESGQPRSGMGVDAADVDGSGRESVLISNFTGEGLSFFRNVDGHSFQDVSAQTGLTASCVNRMGWGLFFVDYDLDGRKDLFVANGHLYPDVAEHRPNMTYAESALLYHNISNGDWRFEEMSGASGDIGKAVVGRGASCADIDRDGDPDILIVTNGGRPLLLRNDGGNRNAWLRIELVGTKSNRDAIGARVDVEAGGRTQMYRVRSGSSYMSDSERTLTVGLGMAATAERITIHWPSGAVDSYKNIAARALLVATESRDARAYPRQDLHAAQVVYRCESVPVSMSKRGNKSTMRSRMADPRQTRGAKVTSLADPRPSVLPDERPGMEGRLVVASFRQRQTAGGKAVQIKEQGTRALKAGKFTEAARLLMEAAKLAPGDSETLTLAGFACLRARRTSDAKRLAQQAVSVNASDAAPYLLLARVCGAQGDHKGAIDAANQYLTRASEPSPGYYLLGALYYQWADYPTAQEWLRKSANANPSSAETWYLLGQIARVLRPAAWREAVDYYERALALNPGYADAHAALGRLLMERKDWPGAIAHLRAALKTASDPAPTYYSLGQALLRAGKRAEAEQAFARYRLRKRSGRKSGTKNAQGEAGGRPRSRAARACRAC